MKQICTRRGFTQKILKDKVILNLIQDLQRLSWLLRNSVRERFQIKFVMTPLWNKKGFTLVELLVVVLIIGILAAVALPQHQKAVVKSRTVQLYAAVNTFSQAAQRYYLENGSWPASFEDLDISLPFSLQEEPKGKLLCNLEGETIIAKGDGFSLEVTSRGSVHALLTKGNYQCAGLFYIQSDSKLYCVEAVGSGKFKQPRGAFCEKILHRSYSPTKATDGVDWFE